MLALAACASRAPPPAPVAGDAGLPAQDVLLLGEQHDAPAHHELQRQAVQTLAARGQLAALALEMAERGRSTAGLAPGASQLAVRSALHWDTSAWPWEAYAPAVMAAVRAGAPVLGANLPPAQMREAMADPRLDGLLPGPALKAQQQAIRSGHCGLLPETRITPMVRVQIARDQAMAGVLAQAAVPGKTVVLIAGGGHVDPLLGVPQHLPAALRVQSAPLPRQAPTKDYCEELRRQMPPAAAPMR